MTTDNRIDPSLDRETVRKLRTIGVEYASTHWSAHYGEWQHHIIVTAASGRLRHALTKTDAGIAALLEAYHKREDRPYDE